MNNLATYFTIVALLIITQPRITISWFFDIAAPNGFIIQQSTDLKNWTTYCNVTNVNTNTFKLQIERTNDFQYYKVGTVGIIFK